MKLSIIIVNYNVKYYVEQCLNSVLRSVKGIEAEVIVVDNHSKDGSVEYLKSHFPEVNVVASNHNLGFARANNIGIRQSQGELILLLNPDTFVGEQTIKKSVEFIESHDDIGALGVRMLCVDGSAAKESRRGMPTPMTAFYKMIGLCNRFPKNKRFGHYYLGTLPWDEPVNIEVVSGAYCMVRRSTLDKVGLLDEEFFMYGEDIDLSFRILKGGFKNWYIPANILHYKGESTQKSSFKYVHVFYDAMLIFFRKHYSHLSFWLSIPIKTAVYLKATVELFRMVSNKIYKSLGFFPSNIRIPEYIFLGDEEAIGQCKVIARSNGLSGRFFVADSHSHPNGHLDLADPDSGKSLVSVLDTQRTWYLIVYDSDSYSYDQILDIFSRKPMSRVTLGTYNRKSKAIITCEEIIV